MTMHDSTLSKGNGADDSDWPSVQLAPRSAGDHARQIRRDATTLASEVQSTTADLERYLTDRMRRRPYATLSVAAGLGYVLGGGLASRFTIVVLGVATRLAAAVAVREVAARYQPQAPTPRHNSSGMAAAQRQQRSDHDD